MKKILIVMMMFSSTILFTGCENKTDKLEKEVNELKEQLNDTSTTTTAEVPTPPNVTSISDTSTTTKKKVIKQTKTTEKNVNATSTASTTRKIKFDEGIDYDKIILEKDLERGIYLETLKLKNFVNKDLESKLNTTIENLLRQNDCAYVAGINPTKSTIFVSIWACKIENQQIIKGGGHKTYRFNSNTGELLNK